MSLTVIHGTTNKIGAVQELTRRVSEVVSDGILYIGYPVIATADESVAVDALLVSPQFGVAVFYLLDRGAPVSPDDAYRAEIDSTIDRLVSALTSRLLMHASLARRGQLVFQISAAAINPNQASVSSDEPPPESLIAPTELGDWLRYVASPLQSAVHTALLAAVQRVATIRPRKKRTNVTAADSRGAHLKHLEREIANLDKFQNQATIETPEGPQRIRGLAGSGKTIVLALKAAYLHAQHPDWRIVVTFHTRSLYQQFRELIAKFYFEQSGDDPDWEMLQILHSWGSDREQGLYSLLARHAGETPMTFSSAKHRFGFDGAFDGACQELLARYEAVGPSPQFDCVLIDEAQDSPTAFFRLVWAATKRPKRVVWAYDELQSIGSEPSQVPPPQELFATKSEPFVGELRHDEGQPHCDIVLPVCYRNTKWCLTAAHALGFGIYREPEFVQMFDDQKSWEEVGYRIASGTGVAGQPIVVERRTDSSPAFFQRYINSQDAVVVKEFGDRNEQYEWLATEITKNVKEDELEYNDILVVLPESYTAPSVSAALSAFLRARGIQNHVAGVTTSRDDFFRDGSVAISGIFRAKGNEAPMVYVVNAEYCASGSELTRKRNVLFTAMTRSRAWVRVLGVGVAMRTICEEYEKIRNNDYRFNFRVPGKVELARMRALHRELTEAERRARRTNDQRALEAADFISSGEVSQEVVQIVEQALRERKGK